MIEILKNPRKRENKKYKITCHNCGCVFTCETSDWTHDVITGHGQRDDVINCPVCTHTFLLSCLFTLGEGEEIEN